MKKVKRRSLFLLKKIGDPDGKAGKNSNARRFFIKSDAHSGIELDTLIKFVCNRAERENSARQNVVLALSTSKQLKSQRNYGQISFGKKNTKALPKDSCKAFVKAKRFNFILVYSSSRPCACAGGEVASTAVNDSRIL